MNGQTANLITDCGVTEIDTLLRKTPANIRTDGIFVFGRDLLKPSRDTYFEVSWGGIFLQNYISHIPSTE